MENKNLKKIIEDDLKYICSLSVEEYTLYRKWLEIQEKYKNESSSQDSLIAFFGNVKPSIVPSILQVKNNIWVPKTIEDYEKLVPKVIPVKTPFQIETWNILRTFTHTAHFLRNVGRFCRYYITDEITGKYLGIISMGSDFIAIGGRDRYIGWSTEGKLQGNTMLNNTCMGSTIAPTQPLGYNGLGGKLIALLVLSEPVIDHWNKSYPKNILAGVTTTSLYGGLSQYTRLKYWRQCDSTEGEYVIEPSDQVYRLMRHWMKENYPGKIEEFESLNEDGSIPTRPKSRVISFVFRELKVKSVKAGFTRGVYFASLYTKTREFLREEVKEPGEKLFDNRVETLSNLWKERYMRPRLKNMIDTNRYNCDILFYDKLINLSWEETKNKYLHNVGR